MTEAANNPPQKRILFCNFCKTETNHVCQSEYSIVREYERDFWEEKRYRLWICAGCDNAILEVAYQDAGYGSEDNWDINYYPKQEENDLVAKSFIKLSPKLNNLYRETIQSFNNGLAILCAAGLRALIEGICDDKGMEGKNLEAKIDSLKNILPANIVTNIHGFRFIGNAAIHELNPPKIEALQLAIEIVEDLLNFLYELDYKTSRLSRYRQTGSIYEPPPPPKKS
ncbi:MAG: DUF4145 domain-containing protein [Anaerolineaceae bacterium]|jgi:hypothetical protein